MLDGMHKTEPFDRLQEKRTKITSMGSNPNDNGDAGDDELHKVSYDVTLGDG